MTDSHKTGLIKINYIYFMLRLQGSFLIILSLLFFESNFMVFFSDLYSHIINLSFFFQLFSKFCLTEQKKFTTIPNIIYLEVLYYLTLYNETLLHVCCCHVRRRNIIKTQFCCIFLFLKIFQCSFFTIFLS